MTIKDIARLANVSTATVSRILNNSKKVKSLTRLVPFERNEIKNEHNNK